MNITAKQKKAVHALVDDMLELISDGAEEEVDEDEEEEEEKPTRTRKKKTAAKKKAPAKKKRASRKKAEEEEEEDEGDEEEEETAVTLNQLRKAMRGYSASYGKDAVKELLEPYGVKTLSAVEEEDYAALMGDIENAEEED